MKREALKKQQLKQSVSDRSWGWVSVESLLRKVSSDPEQCTQTERLTQTHWPWTRSDTWRGVTCVNPALQTVYRLLYRRYGSREGTKRAEEEAKKLKNLKEGGDFLLKSKTKRVQKKDLTQLWAKKSNFSKTIVKLKEVRCVRRHFMLMFLSASLRKR